jgi:excisionase family DNA binding protein
MEPFVLSIEEARRAIGIGRTKLYELINSGALETMTIGRRRLVTVGSIKRLVDILVDPQPARPQAEHVGK